MIHRNPQVGDVVVARRAFRSDDFNSFATLSGDRSPLHHDAAYAARTSVGVPIVPALLAASPLSAAAGMALPGHRSLVLGVEIRAVEPIVYDEDVVYSFRVMTISTAMAVLHVRALALQRGRVVLEGQLRVRVRDDVADVDGPAEPWGSLFAAAHPRRVLVTGASGAIGSACARALAARGRQVTLQYRSEHSRTKTLAAELGASAQVEHLLGDLSDPECLAATAAALTRTPVTAIVHAASPAIDAPAAKLHEVNYTALRTLVDNALPGMLERQEGTFVTIGSEAVRTAPSGWDDYVAAKVAATSFIETVGRRHRGHGISVTVVHPSYVAGEYSAAYRPEGVAALLPEEVAELVAGVVVDGHTDSSELWLRPGIVERGPAAGAPTVQPRSDARQSDAAPSKGALAPSDARQSDKSLPREVERVARDVLRLKPSVDMTDAALGRTENWTSLAQIEMLVALEEEFGITFTSAELSGMPSLSDLKALVTHKVS
jgi:3-oxoacyl-[acyl-carrier protein] reductase